MVFLCVFRQSALASFSSRGPGVDIPGVARQQPYIDGPGVSVVSSYAGSDTQCGNFPLRFLLGWASAACSRRVRGRAGTRLRPARRCRARTSLATLPSCWPRPRTSPSSRSRHSSPYVPPLPILPLATVFCAADGGLWLAVRTTRSARCRSRPAPSRSARACRTPPPPTSSTAGARSASARRCPRWASPATTSRESQVRRRERGDSKRLEPARAGGRREREEEALEI